MSAAERAGENGLKVVLFEKRALGVCLNEGAYPRRRFSTPRKYTAILYMAIAMGS